MGEQPRELDGILQETSRLIDQALEQHQPKLEAREVGTLTYLGHGIARVKGLGAVRSEELLRFPGDRYGLAFNVDPGEVGVILLDESEGLGAGQEARRTGRVLEVPVGEAVLSRIVDPLGRPIDRRGPVRAAERRPVEREARPIMDRAPVTVPLQTGQKVIDALIPIGRGQRELILGDRQTGKTAITVDTIINQEGEDVVCIYCAVGKRSSAVARVLSDLREHQALDYCTLVVATEDDPPGWQFIAPYAATTMGEYFMEQGADVLVVYDDLTRHARAYRELSLLLRRPPGREAFPGDIFYIHSRLLERSTHLREELGGGSLSALPIVETEAQNVSAYIPTNLISITDGQVYLSPDLFQKGNMPAVDVGKSVSRVGGKTQLPAYRAVAGDLRLAYSQFEELETFARFGTRLDEDTRRTIERGRRIREVFKQAQYDPIPVPQQIAALVAVNGGLLDDLPLEKARQAERLARQAVAEQLPKVCQRIQEGEKLSDEDRKAILETAEAAIRAEFGEPDQEAQGAQGPQSSQDEQGEEQPEGTESDEAEQQPRPTGQPPPQKPHQPSQDEGPAHADPGDAEAEDSER
ncbi:MAG: alternate F1F0 ATPase, F1 subunit alpha [Candidatus Brocadiia bacterium]